MANDSFKNWMIGQIRALLKVGGPGAPFIMWCDANREWLELLRMASAADGFELWANPQQHELLVRDRFCRTPRAARVVWLPSARMDLTWMKVFELEAQQVWERSLLDALREYGVRIPSGHERELAQLLPAYTRERFDHPSTAWDDITTVTVPGTLMDDQRMLDILAGESGQFDALKQENQFGLFVRRASDDFGFPSPESLDEQNWRVDATARLLATEAAQGSPQSPPSEGDRVIPPGTPRDNSLRLLRMWQNHIQFIPAYEKLTEAADRCLGLAYWARNLPAPPRSKGSRAVEEALFGQFVDRFDRIEDVGTLAVELQRCLAAFNDRKAGFWGHVATHRVGWEHIASLAEVAALIVEESEIAQKWRSTDDAVRWYTSKGWVLDQAGERLFREDQKYPKQLHRIRSRLRRGYLRTMDGIGRTFADLLAREPDGVFGLPTAGEVLLEELGKVGTPTAIVYLDACRFELGKRLADLVNEGEPAERAAVRPAVAPVPSITSLGMACALPVQRGELHISMTQDKKEFQVTCGDFVGDLTIAALRRNWLTAHMKVKDFISVADVFDPDKIKPASKTRRMLVVHGAEFDTQGHEGQLELDGAEGDVRRYAQAIRQLRAAGYNRVIVVTDHGFFHWQPEADEVEPEKPEGEVYWLGRRAAVGRGLQHKSAIRLPVMSSDLEVMVPRSVNAFRTYGGLGYFHGGAALQELIIPVVVVQWPTKAAKIPVVLKPVGHIATEKPRVQVEPAADAQGSFFADSNQMARRVSVKVREAATGKVVFRHSEPMTVEPGGTAKAVELELVDPRPTLSYGTELVVEVRDADDEELLREERAILKVEINEW